MHNFFPKACVKIVGSHWKRSVGNVDERPQKAVDTNQTHDRTVYNRRLLPEIPHRYTSTFPQATTIIYYLLNGILSPLSPAPITTTTNLKNKKR